MKLEQAFDLFREGVRSGRLAQGYILVAPPKGEGSALAERVLVAHPWLHRLDPLLLSGRIGLAKPDPRLFEHALAALALPAGEVLFVDDRDENVAAAESVGMAGHVFTGIDGLRPVVEAHLGR